MNKPKDSARPSGVSKIVKWISLSLLVLITVFALTGFAFSKQIGDWYFDQNKVTESIPWYETSYKLSNSLSSLKALCYSSLLSDDAKRETRYIPVLLNRSEKTLDSYETSLFTIGYLESLYKLGYSDGFRTLYTESIDKMIGDYSIIRPIDAVLQNQQASAEDLQWALDISKTILDKNNDDLFKMVIYYEQAQLTERLGNSSKSAELMILSENQRIMISEIQEYADDNPIVIGLYMKYDDGRKLLTTYSGKFVNDIDVGVFAAVATHQAVIRSTPYQTVWKSYWDKYTGIENYKIGYHISFTIKSGEVIEKNILSPADTPSIVEYIRLYLYDDVNQIPGGWYSHLLVSEVTDKTIITSIKLTGAVKTSEIVGPITLTVFTYNDSEDFDPITQLYRGKSSYSILINRQ